MFHAGGECVAPASGLCLETAAATANGLARVRSRAREIGVPQNQGLGVRHTSRLLEARACQVMHGLACHLGLVAQCCRSL